MEKLFGQAAFRGIAVGKISEIKKEDYVVRREHIEDVEQETQRFYRAMEEAASQLKDLYEKALREVGETNAAIFEVHKMMLEDRDFVESILNIIEMQSVNAEYAAAATGDNFSQIFATMEDQYMRERAIDIKDISDRLVRILTQREQKSRCFKEPVIVAADDLTPSETVQLDKEKVLAFVTRRGSVNSHTAILARTMNIPAVVNVPVPDDADGRAAVVNGYEGILILEPEDADLQQAEKIRREEEEKNSLLLRYKGKPTATKSGREIKLYANIGGVSDIGAVIQNDAAGIGLFRSEFLYLQEEDYPSEEKQFRAYRQAAEMMAGKKVIIRTLDIGADKKIEYFKLGEEENPAMGYRAIRICLTREDVFKTQLRALYRASVYGTIAIMIPMIISLWEVRKVKGIMEEVKAELRTDGIPFREVEFGIMIETPAAVMMADELAWEVDFFSIGTNDLTQYTLAIDRQNQQLDKFYDAHHPALLKMIRIVVEEAHKAGIWAGICGELAADTELTRQFVEMGIDELSVSPGMILPVREQICEME